ncbi:MAG: acetolactate synthase small subunit [Syntrophobacterales bacterium]|nr:acetolactate synthase small subunit [Syntrophobacterales bacterium]
MNGEKHIISILVSNKPGVLSRVSGVFGRLGYNIKSLCVAETADPEISRITLVSRANFDFTEKTKKQLDKLVDVIEVTELMSSESIERELVLIGINMDEEQKPEITRAIDMFGCSIIFMKSNYCILEVVGDKDKTETVINYLKPLGIKEINRTGIIAL